MKFFSDFFRAVANCFKAFSVLFEKGLWPYMLVFLFLWLLLWVLSIYGLFILADGISNWMSKYIDLNAIPEEGHWLSFIKPYLIGTFKVIVKIIFKLLFWFISATFIKYVLLMVLSPVFSLLSEKTEQKLTGNVYSFSFIQLVKDSVRGILISLRNMLLEYFFIFCCFILCVFFPPIVVCIAPFLLLLGWYYVGFSLLDYNCERHKYSILKSINFIRKNKGTACGIGFVYSVFMALPFMPGSVLGIMFGPSLGVVGGAISFLEITKTEIREAEK